jgi:hypothetical protein
LLVGGCCDGVVEEGRTKVEAAGGGNSEVRLNGLGTGRAECEETDRRVRGGVSLLWGEGVVAERGLKLCPMTVSFKFVEAFHRGFVSDLSDRGVVERTEDVGVFGLTCDGEEEGIASSREPNDLRGI